MKNYFILISVVILVSFLSISIKDTYAAANIDLADQLSCQASPLFGTWNGTASTCVISKLRLNSDDSLNVDNSVFSNIVLTITGTVDNDGSITNSGTITISHGGAIEDWGKIINNQKGTITNYGTLTINELGTIINNGGTINNYAILLHNIRGAITNSGVIKNMCGGSYTSDTILVNKKLEEVFVVHPNHMIILQHEKQDVNPQRIEKPSSPFPLLVQIGFQSDWLSKMKSYLYHMYGM